MATQVITAPTAPQTVPFALANTAATPITPLTVSASFNGAAAAADFIPCLSFYTTDGRLLGRYIGGSTVTAGDTAQRTFAPFLRTSSTGTGGGIQFDTDPQAGTFLYVETTGADPGTGYGQNIISDIHGTNIQSVGDVQLTGDNSITGDSQNVVSFTSGEGGSGALTLESAGTSRVGIDSHAGGIRIRTIAASGGGITIDADQTLAEVGNAMTVTIDTDEQHFVTGDILLNAGGQIDVDGELAQHGGNAGFTIPNGGTFTVFDHNGNPKIRWTEGTTDLHLPTGGSVVFDL